MTVCLGFYAVSTLFQLLNSDSSQIQVSWTIFLPSFCLTSPLSRHWRASHSVSPIILSAKGKSHYYQFLKTLVCRGRGSNPQPRAHEADALTTRPPQQSNIDWKDLLSGDGTLKI